MRARAAARQLDARLALAARRRRRALLAVERAGQDPGARGLAAAARAGEQVGVVHPVVVQRLRQRRGDVVLPDHLGERLRAVAPVQGQTVHPPHEPVARRRGERPRAEGTPRAPGRAHLPLLPSGPGGVGQDTATRGVGASLREPRGRPDRAVDFGAATSTRRYPPATEDSHSGLVRTLGKRVGVTPSGVRIPYPPPRSRSDL